MNLKRELLIDRVNGVTAHPKVRELLANELFLKMFDRLLMYREEMDKVVVDSTAPANKRLSSADKRDVLDFVLELPFNLVEEER